MLIYHAARIQVKQTATKQPVTRPQSEYIRPTSKNQAQATSNCLSIGTYVMYKTPPSKLWYAAIITNILQYSQSFIITTSDGTTYRHVMLHLKPYMLPISQRTQVFAQPLPLTIYKNIPSKCPLKQVRA